MQRRWSRPQFQNKITERRITTRQRMNDPSSGRDSTARVRCSVTLRHLLPYTHHRRLEALCVQRKTQCRLSETRGNGKELLRMLPRIPVFRNSVEARGLPKNDGMQLQPCPWPLPHLHLRFEGQVTGKPFGGFHQLDRCDSHHSCFGGK